MVVVVARKGGGWRKRNTPAECCTVVVVAQKGGDWRKRSRAESYECRRLMRLTGTIACCWLPTLRQRTMLAGGRWSCQLWYTDWTWKHWSRGQLVSRRPLPKCKYFGKAISFFLFNGWPFEYFGCPNYKCFPLCKCTLRLFGAT